MVKLHQLCYSANVEVAEFVLERRANVDALSQNGSTPLLVAARQGQLRMVEVLLRFGADPDDGGDKGWSPLFISSAEGHLEIVNILLEYGANPNLQLYVSEKNAHSFYSGGKKRPTRGS